MSKTMIIAELSGNHNNDLQYTKDTIYEIKKSGADAVKLQTYTADSLTLNVNNATFGPREDGLWKGRTPYEAFSEGALPYGWHQELFQYAESLGLICFSSPFDTDAVDFLESLQNPIYKVASFEIAHIPLIQRIAETGKPVIISTGIASLADIETAISYFDMKNITLLKCTSAYPTPFSEVNLRAMKSLGEIFGVDVGLSDHTLGSAVPIAAVAIGAKVIEKHFILDKSRGGIDADFSMTSSEFKDMVKGIREVEEALGNPGFSITESALKSRARGRTIYVSVDSKKGSILSPENVRVVRGGGGLDPKYYNMVLGKKFKHDVSAGEPLRSSELTEFNLLDL